MSDSVAIFHPLQWKRQLYSQKLWLIMLGAVESRKGASRKVPSLEGAHTFLEIGRKEQDGEQEALQYGLEYPR